MRSLALCPVKARLARTLLPLSDLLPQSEQLRSDRITALYSGHCPLTGEALSIPRTELAERAARALMRDLPATEDKMFGVLIVARPCGDLGLLKAFSGRLDGSFHHDGWVPPLFEETPTPLEINTKGRLAAIKAELFEISQALANHMYPAHKASWKNREDELWCSLAERRAHRRQLRMEGHSAHVLDAESRRDSACKRDFKSRQREALGGLESEFEQLEKRRLALISERRELSRTLQAALHRSFEYRLWKDKPWSLASLFPSGPPTGVGECCAPKLLHYAREHGLRPLALAEFWWGASSPERQRGEFYSACQERCVPLLGALLTTRAAYGLRVLWEDEWMVAVDKPGGLLSVPGREDWNQDSVLLRLRGQGLEVYPVHRLDLETSGVLLMAKSVPIEARLRDLFATGRVEKLYEALLDRAPDKLEGQIDLALGPDPAGPGLYRPDPDGKPALTSFRVIDRSSARLELRPHTGRSHQLRVHARYALQSPIRGDRRYGSEFGGRLMLHARALCFQHPITGEKVEIETEPPF